MSGSIFSITCYSSRDGNSSFCIFLNFSRRQLLDWSSIDPRSQDKCVVLHGTVNESFAGRRSDGLGGGTRGASDRTCGDI